MKKLSRRVVCSRTPSESGQARQPAPAVFEPLEERLLLSLVGATPGLPLMSYNSTGVVDYATVAETFDSTATPLAYLDSGGTPHNILGGSMAIHIGVDSVTQLPTGTVGDDLIVTGTIDLNNSGTVDAGDISGVLLTGEVAEFGFLDVGTTDKFDFRFLTTGGALAGDFTGQDIGVLMTSENSTFTGSFDTDFHGGAKGIIGAITPEVVEQVASIGDRVWLDTNADGIQDAGENGIDGVTVNLLDGSGAFLDTTVTSGGGLYLFDGLVPGDYQIEFVAPPGYLVSPQDQGIDDAVDSDADPVTGKTIVTTLVADENDLTWDMGLYELAAIGDRVWFDANADGIQDGGENGIDGVTVNLLDGSGAFLDTTVTSGGGLYLFDNLTPGDYQIEFVAPAGYLVSPQDQGLDDAADSDADLATGKTIVTTLVSGETDLTWDMGVFPTPATAAIDIEKYVKGETDCGTQGLTPGYWKQCHHFDDWVGYQPGDSYNAIFGVSDADDPTLLEALKRGGGGSDALGRHAVAALLNANNPLINFAYSPAEVIAYVQYAYNTDNYEPVKDLLETQNTKGNVNLKCATPAPDCDDNGFGDDADTATGPVLNVGDLAIFTYVVTNADLTDLENVVVVDDNATAADTGDDFNPTGLLDGSGFNVGDVNQDNILQVGEEWLYTAVTVVTAGQHTNIATVTGDPVGGGDQVTDSDPANWFGEEPTCPPKPPCDDWKPKCDDGDRDRDRDRCDDRDRDRDRDHSDKDDCKFGNFWQGIFRNWSLNKHSRKSHSNKRTGCNYGYASKSNHSRRDNHKESSRFSWKDKCDVLRQSRPCIRW